MAEIYFIPVFCKFLIIFCKFMIAYFFRNYSFASTIVKSKLPNDMEQFKVQYAEYNMKLSMNLMFTFSL